MILEEEESVNKVKQRATYVYDENGNLLEELNSRYDYVLDDWAWTDVTKKEYTYTIDEQVTIEYDWNNEKQKWEKSRKRIHFNNPLGFTEQELDYAWVISELMWVESSKTTYIYNQNSEVTSETIQYFDSFEQIWKNTLQSEYTYEDGKRTSFTYSSWYNAWDPFSRLEYYYDEDGALSEVISFGNSGGGLKKEKKSNIIVNRNILSNEILWPTSEESLKMFFFQPLSVEEYIYSDGGVESYSSTYTYNYSDALLTSVISSKAIDVINLYPNPTTESINVSSADYKGAAIYNNLGNVVLGTNMTNESMINVEALKDGIYTLELVKNNNEVVRGRFIKK